MDLELSQEEGKQWEKKESSLHHGVLSPGGESTQAQVNT